MKFTWENFDSRFLMEIIENSDKPEEFKKSARECSDDKERLVSKMNLICPVPTENFIYRYRPIIEQDCLKFYKGTMNKIFKALNITGNSFNEKQIKLSKKASSNSLIKAYAGALYEISGLEVELTEYTKYSSTVAVNMKETETEDVQLYDFQAEAVARLKKFFVDEDNNEGILVMPTGSGKSRTAVNFLIKEMAGRGYQILWIAHRHMLLDQAADNFYKMAGLAKVNNPEIKNYRISCISGNHMSIRQVGKHEIIIASIASISRNREHLKRILGSKVMIVVDEAHHTVARSYDEVISFVRKCRKDVKLLGLTATPVRAAEKGTAQLLRLYGNNIVYQKSMSDLIAAGILAVPKFKQVKTGEDFEPVISDEEAEKIRKTGELPPSLISKIADSRERNQIILKEYLDHKNEYGKTLIFALNVVHCRFLYEELKRHKVKCGLVYSGKEDNSRVINDFREGRYEVLVNVNIMTEGTDVPDIQTVFLTRPTASEGFLMQMIGRGMRGTRAGGTESVTIVDFHDQWSVFNKWLDPEFAVKCELTPGSGDKEQEYKKNTYVEYDWRICQQVYKSFKAQMSKYDVVLSVPVAWYTLVDHDGELRRMLIFENQMEGILSMMKDKEKWIDSNVSGGEIIQKYFKGFEFIPSADELELLMDNVKNFDTPPALHILENRKSVDPYYVFQKADELGADVFEYAAQTYDENEIVRDIYPDKDSYILEVCKAKINKGRNIPMGIKVEELPLELIPFDRTPCYDLDNLVQKVKDKMFDGSFDGIDSIEWTDCPYKIYYGKHTINTEGEHHIRINSILNSKDVPEEAVMFVIYHELLHRDNMTHDKAFKEEEHKYPGFAELEYFLDGQMAKFDIYDK